MKKKKIIIAILLVVLPLFFASCDSDNHEHKYDSIVVDPTCTDEGYTKYTCSCGDSYKDNITSALGHIEVIDPAVAATCEENGRTEGKHCSVCNEILVAQEVIPFAHIKAYEYDEQYHYSMCTLCGDEFSKEEHTFVNGICECGYDVAKSKGLEYTLLGDDTYAVSGVGSFTGEELVIPSYYNNKLVTVIADNAFYNCKAVKYITIPSSIVRLGDYVFADCNNLLSVAFEEGSQLKAISSHAFYDCNSLINITIPKNIEVIGEDAFNNCISINKVEFEEGSKLEVIENEAFEDCDSLINITIPANIKTIGDNAFEDCELLTEIVFEEGSKLESIGEQAFYYCSALISITIPANVNAIGNEAFLYCVRLFEVYNLSSLNIEIGSEDNGYIGYYAMYIYTSLDEESNITTDENGFIFIKDKNNSYNLINYIGVEENVVLPSEYNGTTYDIYDFSFVYSNIKSVVIPNGIAYIGENAFAYCYELTRIVLPNSINNIGDNAFRGCYKLAEVYNLSSLDIEAGNKDYGYTGYYAMHIYTSLDEESNITTDENGFVFIKDENNIYYLIGYEGNEKDIILPADFKGEKYHIYSCAFLYSSITSVVISDGVISIGSDAFYECISLESVTISSSVVSIDDYAFSYCENLERVAFAEGSNLEAIGDEAFYYCESLENITIPKSVTSIGDAAFSYCFGLTKFEIEEGSQLSSIEDYVFYYCESLTAITIPSSVIAIGVSAFESCGLLAEIKFEEGSKLVSIGSDAFFYCSNLTNIIIPANVTSIGDNAFLYCVKLFEVYNLSSLNIEIGSDANGNVGYYALYIYTSLDEESKITIDENGFMYLCDESNEYYLMGYIGNEENIVLPSDYKDNKYHIYSNAFKGSSIKSIVISEGVLSIGEYAFCNCNELKTVIFEAENQLESIGENAFENCGSLTAITIPSSVTSIGESAFYNCCKLYEVYNLSSLNIEIGSEDNGYIGYYAMYIYTSLEDESKIATDENGFMYICAQNNEYYLLGYTKDNNELVLPDNLNGKKYHINYSAFKGSSITSVVISEGVLSIGGSAFYDCSKLKTVIFEEGSQLDFIGASAFGNCESLIDITIPSSVTSIGEYAFKHCESLKSITIPRNVTGIGEYAFNACFELKEVIFEEGSQLKNIGASAFEYCDSLTNITIPGNVTGIECAAFSYCYSLESITIPNSVIDMEDSVFLYCEGLKTAIFEEGSQLKNIGASAFEYCSALSKVVLPASIAEIDSYAFANCKNLNDINTSSITKFGYAAFDNCSSLEDIVISKNAEIAFAAFNRCTGLKMVYYLGTAEEFTNIVISSENDAITDATIYYYSELKPTGDGAYWYFDENNNPTIWE